MSQLSVVVLLTLIAVAFCGERYATSSFVRGSHTIYYPVCVGCDIGDDDCMPIRNNQKFPFLIFNTGGSVLAEFYSNFASRVAGNGYIVIVPNGFPSTTLILRAKGNLTGANADSTSPIYDRHDGSWALGGHSVGGVTAIIAASNDAVALCNTPPPAGLSPLCGGYQGFGSPIKAVWTYGTVLVERRSNPNGVFINTNTLNVPVALTRGSDEGNVLIQDYHWTFDSALETPKAFFQLQGANHYGITNVVAPPGATPEPNPQTRDSEWTVSKCSKIAAAFLNAHVAGKQNIYDKIYVDEDIGGAQISVVAADDGLL